MARTEARIFASVWNDDDFVALSPGAQWLYWLLLSQPELSMCGVLTIAIGRWANLAAGVDENHIALWIRELHDGRFIVLDDDTAEIWVRAFVRRDGVLRTPNFAVAMARAWEAVHSRIIRAGVIHEAVKEFDGAFEHGMRQRFPKGFPHGLEVRFPPLFLAATAAARCDTTSNAATSTNEGFPEPIDEGMRDAVHTHAHARAGHPITPSPHHQVTATLPTHGLEPHQPPAPDTTSPEARPDDDTLLEQTWQRLAQWDLEQQLERDPGYVKSSRAKVLAAFAATRRDRHEHDARLDLKEHPTLTVEDLAERLDPGCGPDDGGRARALASAARVEARAAAMEAEDEERRTRLAEADRRIAALTTDQRDELTRTAEADVGDITVGRAVLVRTRVRELVMADPVVGP